MRWSALACVLMAAILSSGCKSKPKSDVATVPATGEPGIVQDGMEGGGSPASEGVAGTSGMQSGFVTLPAVPPPGTTTSSAASGRYVAAPTSTAAPVMAADASAPVAAAPAGGKTYVVQKGDTLYSIARKQYNNAAKWKDIASANNITDAKKLAVGQKLVLP
ncbi:MAG: LysM peptidoglycan-binding domain-containing protein [Phycisphaeraceae bacterium]|nr:LysM peptidoglycan-binding domain-containing protein [Phycisphaeraceae bacterium]